MTSSEPRVGVVGRIVAGEEVGRYLKVLDDSVNTGGYLVLTAANEDLTEDGADAWVEGAAELAGYFEESGWTVEWLG